MKRGSYSHKSDCKCPFCNAKGKNNIAKRSDVREKIRQSKFGDKNPMKRPEVIKKMIETSRKNGCYEESSKRLKRLWQEGKVTRGVMSEEARRKAKRRMKTNNPMQNSTTARKQGETLKRAIQVGKVIPFGSTEKGKKIISKASSKWLKENNPMKNPEIAEKQHRTLLKLHYTKNKTETFIDDIIQRHFPNKWKYVGDGKTFIGGKVPDWITVGDSKKIIEYTSTYWHQTAIEQPIEKYIQERTKHFWKYGFKVLFIFDGDLNEEKIIEKVENFWSLKNEMG